MDEFVRSKLDEWGLSELKETFKVECIDKEALYCLDDEDLGRLNVQVGLRALLRKKLKSLQRHELGADDSAQVGTTLQDGQSSSGTRDIGKRMMDLPGELSSHPPHKRHCGQRWEANTEGNMTEADVKRIMERVYNELENDQETDLNVFLKTEIDKLKTDKRELVGVFGKTGAGKSSLINAVIEEENLLPSGSVSACTSVMIKVEANTINSKYEAEIEFITEKEWKNELLSMDEIHKVYQEKKKEMIKEEHDDYRDSIKKLEALYGDDWKHVDSLEKLLTKRKFKEITDLLHSRLPPPDLSFDSAEQLSQELLKYTKNNPVRQTDEIKRWYWPLVKCVTVRVPRNDFLQHVTLVDLPGNGDRNKSRDNMWKEIVGSCSTVWIVTDAVRAASDEPAWEILEDACSLMGNGGECQRIHFICTKSDVIGNNSGDGSTSSVRDAILERNKNIKDEVEGELSEQQNLMEHFTEDCFKVFTVSSTEFLKTKYLQRDDTEIPNLQEFLKTLNAHHSVTLNYVSGAYGILSLIQGARCRDVAEKKTVVCRELEETMRVGLHKVGQSMEEAYKAFEKHLTKGVEKSIHSFEGELKSILEPEGKSGRGYHRTVRCLVEKNGIHKPRDGRQININEKLSSSLTESINVEFRKTFPNQQKHEPFKGAIKAFSLNTKSLIKSHKDMELQLTFLQTEEEKMKTVLKRDILDYKKKIYNSLTETIKKNMQGCYEEAAEYSGDGSLEKMRETIYKHVDNSKDTMFEDSKKEMLTELKKLKEKVLEDMEKILKESIKMSLKTDHSSIPGVSEPELDQVKKYYSKLKLTSTQITN